MSQNRAVFFDRDGTLVEAIVRENFPKAITAPFCLGDIKFSPGAFHVPNVLRQRGFKIFIVTNQPDVAHGYLSEEEWEKVHYAIVKRVQPDDVFLCRHRTVDNCGFKKPSHLMLQYAACRYDLDLSLSYIVGDTENDTMAGRVAGCRTILINRPYNGGVKSDIVVDDLFELLRVIK